MAQIPDLTEITTLADDDLLVTRDLDAAIDKKITWSNIKAELNLNGTHSDTQVLFNDSGVISGHSGLTYDGAGQLTLGTRLVAPVWRPASDSTTALQMQTASGTAVLTVDTTNSIVSATNIGLSANNYRLTLGGAARGTVYIGINTSLAVANDILNFAAVGNVTGSLFGFNYNVPATGSFTNLFRNTRSTTGSHVRFEITTEGSGGGDPKFVYTISGVRNWCAGVDNSDGDKYKISRSDSPGLLDALTIDTDGNVGIGTTAPNNLLDVAGTIQCDGLRIDATPTAETPSATHTAVVNFDGTNYKILLASA